MLTSGYSCIAYDIILKLILNLILAEGYDYVSELRSCIKFVKSAASDLNKL